MGLAQRFSASHSHSETQISAPLLFTTWTPKLLGKKEQEIHKKGILALTLTPELIQPMSSHSAVDDMHDRPEWKVAAKYSLTLPKNSEMLASTQIHQG